MNETRNTILHALSDGPVSGPDLADRLGISRAAVWKHVEGLREAGFDVVSADDGYTLASIPEYGGPAVVYGLDAPFDVEYHESIPSTNDRARELAEAGRAESVVLANEQTGGRGRLDREWASPPGGIWMSVLLRPALPAAHAPILTLAAAVATTRAVRNLGVEAGVKWPNDVLVPGTKSDGQGERKLAGILTEMEGETDEVDWVAIGIGLNANVHASSLPDGSTSLRAVIGDVSRREVVQTILEELDDLRTDPRGILDAWRMVALTLGRRVHVETPGDTVVGDAVDVAFPGSLVVETETGRVRVHAGDCEHLRPTE